MTARRKFADHLHEHFVPPRSRAATVATCLPRAPGLLGRPPPGLVPPALTFPGGAVWTDVTERADWRAPRPLGTAGTTRDRSRSRQPPRSANMFTGRNRRRRRSNGRRRVGWRHPLLRHRAPLRARHRGTAAGPARCERGRATAYVLGRPKVGTRSSIRREPRRAPTIFTGVGDLETALRLLRADAVLRSLEESLNPSLGTDPRRLSRSCTTPICTKATRLSHAFPGAPSELRDEGVVKAIGAGHEPARDARSVRRRGSTSTCVLLAGRYFASRSQWRGRAGWARCAGARRRCDPRRGLQHGAC